MKKVHLSPETMPAGRGYSQIIDVSGGRTIYISGQIALDAQRKLVGAGDLEAQTVQVFENLKAALAAVGATFDNVVKLGIFVLDFEKFDLVRKVRDRYVDTSRPPTATALAVVQLAHKDYLIEVEAVAVVS